MKRIGMYTGRIYDENIDLNTIQECCVVIDNPTQEDVNKARIKCITCSGDKDCLKGKNKLI
jgi:hypothetical protein